MNVIMIMLFSIRKTKTNHEWHNDHAVQYSGLCIVEILDIVLSIFSEIVMAIDVKTVFKTYSLLV